MPPKDAKNGKKKGKKKKPECLAPAEVILPDQQSPEFYLCQIADLEIRVKRFVEDL